MEDLQQQNEVTMIIPRALMYFNMFKCFEISLPVVALQRRHWRQHVVRWLVECNGSLSYTDATWTDGNEVSVLSLRCAETFAQQGMGWRSPLVFFLLWFPLIQTPVLFCACMWRWRVWLLWVTDLCSHLEVHSLMRSSWLIHVQLSI